MNTYNNHREDISTRPPSNHKPYDGINHPPDDGRNHHLKSSDFRTLKDPRNVMAKKLYLAFIGYKMDLEELPDEYLKSKSDTVNFNLEKFNKAKESLFMLSEYKITSGYNLKASLKSLYEEFKKISPPESSSNARTDEASKSIGSAIKQLGSVMKEADQVKGFWDWANSTYKRSSIDRY